MMSLNVPVGFLRAFPRLYLTPRSFILFKYKY